MSETTGTFLIQATVIRMLMPFFPQITCEAPSGFMLVSEQGGSFRSGLSVSCIQSVWWLDCLAAESHHSALVDEDVNTFN